MQYSFITAVVAQARSCYGRLKSDHSGVAAIEFAFIVPIMVILFIGTVELSQAITVDRRVTQIASSTADLVAREKQITTAQLGNVTDLAIVLMKPYDTASLKITLTSVVGNIANAALTTVCWSHNFQGGAATYVKDANYTVPAGMVDAGGSVIIAEVKYLYTPLIFSYFMPGTTTLKDTFYLKPRASSQVQLGLDPIC